MFEQQNALVSVLFSLMIGFIFIGITCCYFYIVDLFPSFFTFLFVVLAASLAIAISFLLSSVMKLYMYTSRLDEILQTTITLKEQAYRE